ncbi:hypothetical protein Cob_v005639 [Colletotrichum orbiculare MAFF 240422]|uniref:Uncharacterized protein n=1 Tax=Colletotrichum orbiculare (strain 104-T / ATCC 96160 / CBS 514.97 / LARS 414 / MAFF 240422) TaxID=1213857 RepID=A0A484FU63_COLOR|nr:hypothetical protein Cob_v005639 [Colletotrichum orbiculare MAFF 240422]
MRKPTHEAEAIFTSSISELRDMSRLPRPTQRGSPQEIGSDLLSLAWWTPRTATIDIVASKTMKHGQRVKAL